MIGALARDGVVACMSIAAATSTVVFRAFIEQVLVPALRERPDAIVVMDNLAAHKAEAVRQAFAAAKIDYRYLPAYSPDLNPITGLAFPVTHGHGMSADVRPLPGTSWQIEACR